MLSTKTFVGHLVFFGVELASHILLGQGHNPVCIRPSPEKGKHTTEKALVINCTFPQHQLVSS